MRFYLDEQLSATIAKIGRGLGLDVTGALELGRRKLTDEEQLRLAAAEGRCLVTADRDFIGITERFAAAGEPHAGVLLVPSAWPTSAYSRIAHAMRAYAERRGGGSTEYLVDYLR